ncbi:MAG: leucine-rich repeat domain-containing protein, partial [Spirochaetales bacterium]|nr:leucine-rich repeat domain-containing protein [Spirochaetales bacterium]
NGGYNLNARNLVLVADGREVANYPGEFTTGTFGREFKIEYDLPKGVKSLVLKGEFRTAGGKLSAGSIIVSTKIYTRQGDTLKVSNGVSTISRWLLWDEPDAKRIELPASVTTIERGALPAWCVIACSTEKQKQFCYENGYLVEGSYSIKDGVLTVNKGVIIASPLMARGNTSITKIILPDTVTTIEPFAFSDMVSLKDVVIPSSVRTIGACAFNGCVSYMPSRIPDTVKYVGPKAFIYESKSGKKVVELGKDTEYEKEDSICSFYGPVEIRQETDSTKKTSDQKGASLFAATEETKYAMDNTGWKNKDFTTEWKAYTWGFSSADLKKGSNTLSFTYTSGSHKLCIKDVEITADGNIIFTDITEKSAGANPKSADYTFTLKSIPQSLVIRAHARTDGGNKSNGTITINGKTASSGEPDKIENGILKLGYGQIATEPTKYLGKNTFTSIEFPPSL